MHDTVMMIRRLHLPMIRAEDVVPFLGRPGHYTVGRSGYCVANSWWKANDLPPTIRSTLATMPEFAHAGLIEGFLEKHVDLGDGKRPSQADLLAIVDLGDALAIMAVEGKVDEPFGNTIGDELRHASAGKILRIKTLCGLLGIAVTDSTPLRYQLLHRTASAVLEARRYRASTAIMMVHSFDTAHANFSDYALFARALDFGSADPGRMIGPVVIGAANLYLGWTVESP